MTRLLPMLVVFALLAAVPGAVAWPWDVQVTPATPRVGDRTLVHIVEPSVELQGGELVPTIRVYDLVSEVVGPTRTIDAFGVERDTLATRFDEVEDGTLVDAYVCHRLTSGYEAVRTDFLMRSEAETRKSSGLIGGAKETTRNSSTLANFGGRCPSIAPPGRPVQEAERVPLGEFMLDGISAELGGVLSSPAQRSEYGGRVALLFTYDARDLFAALPDPTDQGEGSISFIVADDLPWPAAMEIDLSASGESYRATSAILGFDAGTGSALPPPGDEVLPSRNPTARWSAPDRLMLDDAAFALPFPYVEAFKSIMSDPEVIASGWFDAHPDAILGTAFYVGEYGATLGQLPESSAGTWMMFFSDRTAGMSFIVSSTRGVETLAGPLESPVGISRVSPAASEGQDQWALPSEVADSKTLATIAAAHGVDPTNVHVLYYMLGGLAESPSAFLGISELSAFEENGEGLGINFELTTAAAGAIYSQSIETVEEDPLPLSEPARRLSIDEAAIKEIERPLLLGPAAAALATGAGLLGLLIKLLVAPLFTRLRRDRLLDNPVRARLYERIRAEPGLHRAELVDFVGIGEGATRHHLAQLAKHRLVAVLEQEGFVRYFAAGEVPPDIARRESTLRAGSQRAVYDVYAREPALSLREAGARLGMSAPSVHRAKKKLEKAGLLPAAPIASVAEA